MNDLISRQAAIDALERELSLVERPITETRWFDLGLKKAQDVLRELPSAQQWIPCSEKLPKEEKRHYWVCTDTGYQCQCRWTNDVYGLGASDRWEWKIFDIPQYQKVVAWMPLPEPYKGENNATVN